MLKDIIELGANCQYHNDR